MVIELIIELYGAALHDVACKTIRSALSPPPISTSQCQTATEANYTQIWRPSIPDAPFSKSPLEILSKPVLFAIVGMRGHLGDPNRETALVVASHLAVSRPYLPSDPFRGLRRDCAKIS